MTNKTLNLAKVGMDPAHTRRHNLSKGKGKELTCTYAALTFG